MKHKPLKAGADSFKEKSIGKYRRIGGLIKKEGYQISRDPSSLLIALVLPILLMLLSGYAFNLDLTGIRLGVIAENPTPLVNSLVNDLTHSSSFRVTYAHDRTDLEKKLVSNDLRGLIIIPENFEKELVEPGNGVPTLQLLTDGTEPNTALLLKNFVQGVTQNWLGYYFKDQGKGITLPMHLEPRIWFNQNAISRYFLIPGAIAFVLTIIGGLLTALVMAREYERGTMEALMVSPLTVWEIIIGKITPYFMLGMMSLIMAVMVAILVFNVPFRGSLWVLIYVSAVFLIAALSVGLVVSTLAKNQLIAAQIILYLGFLPTFFLSGFLFELESMPQLLQWLSYLFPARYFVSAVRTIFLTGDAWAHVFVDTLGIIAFSVVIILVIKIKLKKRLDA